MEVKERRQRAVEEHTEAQAQYHRLLDRAATGEDVEAELPEVRRRLTESDDASRMLADLEQRLQDHLHDAETRLAEAQQAAKRAERESLLWACRTLVDELNRVGEEFGVLATQLSQKQERVKQLLGYAPPWRERLRSGLEQGTRFNHRDLSFNLPRLDPEL
jgi:predicted nuclease with TOPRIM domain